MTEDLTLTDVLTPPALTERVFRVGAIPVSNALMAVQGITFDMTDTQGRLKEQGVFEAIHAWLLLPEHYTILALYYTFGRDTWSVIVDSPDLPILEAGMEPPEIMPIYEALYEEGVTTYHLKEIRVNP